MLAMPVGVRLEHFGGSDYGAVIQDLSKELNADRQPAFGESAGNAQRRQAEEIANAADGISE
jgi:hypothetical protein